MLYYEIRERDFSVQNNLREITFRSHIHKDIEIMYIRRGTQSAVIGGADYAIGEGQLAAVLPNVIHEYYAAKRLPYNDEILIICSPEFYRSFFPDMSGFVCDTPIIDCSDLEEDAVYALDRISAELPRNVQIGMILIILNRIFEHINIRRTTKKSSQDTVAAILTYINNNFTLPLTTESVARELFISKSYVSRIFSEKINMNFKRYLGLLRAEYAASLMRTTSSNLTAICETAGFESIRSFNRVFKEIYGVTPSEFRRGAAHIDKAAN